MIARYAADVIEHSGYFKPGFSMQTGSGAASTACTRFLGEKMARRGVKAGRADGESDVLEKIAAMQAAYDALCRAVDRGRNTLIDPYAAESTDEFFAVVSELHFSDPALLRRAAPEVAALLSRYYDGESAAA